LVALDTNISILEQRVRAIERTEIQELVGRIENVENYQLALARHTTLQINRLDQRLGIVIYQAGLSG